MTNLHKSKAFIAMVSVAILIFTAIGLADSPVAAVEPADAPTNVSVSLVSDVATITWGAPLQNNGLTGYEYSVYADWISPRYAGDPTFISSPSTVTVAANIQTATVHLMPGSWHISVRSLFGSNQPSDWTQDIPLSVTQASATVSLNYQRVYSTQRTTITPTVLNVSTKYSAVYVVGSNIVRARALNSELGNELSWDEISECNLTADETITLQIVYLSEQEQIDIAATNISPCSQSATTLHISERSVGSSTFTFKIGEIPTASATFITTQPGGNPRSRVATWLDGETPSWYQIPHLVNNVDLHTGNRFISWTDEGGFPESTDYPPVPGSTYYSDWIAYPNPRLPLSVELGGNIIQGSDLTETNFIVWADTAYNSGQLSVSASVIDGVTWRSALEPVDDHQLVVSGVDAIWNNTQSASFDLTDFEACAQLDESPNCYKTFRVDLILEDANGRSDYYFFVVRKTSSAPVALEYVDHNEDTLDSNAEGPRWATVVAPEEIWPEMPDGYFGGWCTVSNPTEYSQCYFPGEHVAVTANQVLYPLIVTNPEPVRIDIGTKTFEREDWVFNSVRQEIYITAESSENNPLEGEIDVVSPFGIEYGTEDFFVEVVEGPPLSDNYGEYSFTPDCREADCSKIFVISNDIYAAGEPQFEYSIYLIASPNPTAEFDVTFDATPEGVASAPGDQIAGETLMVGWHPVPSVTTAHQGYETENEWIDSVTGGGYWNSYFPVTQEQTLTLDWWSEGPIVSGQSSVSVVRGDSFVANFTTDYGNNVDWQLSGSDQFSISNSGRLTASTSLALGTYSLVISAGAEFTGPPFSLEVTVIQPAAQSPAPAPSPSGGGSSGPVPETIEAKPGSKQQPEITARVSVSKLGIGGTTKIILKGGLGDSSKKFTAQTPKVCRVDTSGLVTAKSSGVCTVSVTSIAQDPIYAPANTPPILIQVLPLGKINTASYAEQQGKLVVKASLLSKYRGKVALLALEVLRGDREVRFFVARSVLSNQAIVSFKKFAKPPALLRLGIYVDSKRVFSLGTM